jgi:hypothetical protein
MRREPAEAVLRNTGRMALPLSPVAIADRRRRTCRAFFPRCALASLLISAVVLAQESKPVATVTFSLDFPQSIPDHYVLTVSSDGHAGYDSTGKLTPDSDPADPFHLDFTISAANREKIFDLATKAKYFAGKVDSGKKNIASTGAKVLAYKDGQRSTRAEYNYSPVPAVQEITALFQNISTTLEIGRQLDYYHHYQKLALDEHLKQMEQMVTEKNLAEVQAVAPILQKILADRSVMNVSRARAQRLLLLSGVPASR